MKSSAHHFVTFNPSRRVFNSQSVFDFVFVEKALKLCCGVPAFLTDVEEIGQTGDFPELVQYSVPSAGSGGPVPFSRELCCEILEILKLSALAGIDEAEEVGGGGMDADLLDRMSHSVAYGNSGEVDAKGGGNDGVLHEDVVGG